jgi:NADP-dependent 3-hydroxy acid dehydrogenase YdfG
MKKRNSGLIINIGSVAGSAPYPKGNVYGATKAFVRQFSRNLRADLAGTDIKVSNIEPGAAETEFSIVRFKGDVELAKKVYEGTRALQAIDIAKTIKWIIDQPLRVNIDNIEIMPIDQTYGGLVMVRK